MPSSKPVSMAIPPGGVLAAESVHSRQFRMSMEKHPFYELYYVYKGSLSYFEEGMVDPISLPQGSFYAIDKGRLHRASDQTDVILLLLGLSAPFVDQEPERAVLWRSLRSRSGAILIPEDHERQRIEAAFRTMLAEQAVSRPGGAMMIEAEANRILVTLARLPDDCTMSSSHTRVASVLRRMEETFFDEWDMDAAARSAHLSRRRFSSIFRDVSGSSFLDKRNELRLDHAAQLILERRHSIIGAAFSSGFGDLAHFYRLFRRRFGAPPGEWARLRREQESK